MPGPNQHPRRWLPLGLSDAVDGTDAFAGAMAMLGNLVRQPNSRGIFVPRPGMVLSAAIPDYGGGPVTALETVGNVTYGMVRSFSIPAHDRPLVFNNVARTFVPISGLSASNLPTSQPTAVDALSNVFVTD